MSDKEKSYQELLALTQLYLLQEFEPGQKIMVDPKLFTALAGKRQEAASAPLESFPKEKIHFEKSASPSGAAKSFVKENAPTAKEKPMDARPSAPNEKKFNEKAPYTSVEPPELKPREPLNAAAAVKGKSAPLRASIQEAATAPDFEDIKNIILKELPGFQWLPLPNLKAKSMQIDAAETLAIIVCYDSTEQELPFWQALALAITRFFTPCTILQIKKDSDVKKEILNYSSLKYLLFPAAFNLHHLEKKTSAFSSLQTAKTYLQNPSLKALLWSDLHQFFTVEAIQK